MNNHYCTDEELGIVPGPNTVIYPIIEQAKHEFDTFRNSFKCVDKEELEIWGDYNSKATQMMAINFRMC